MSLYNLINGFTPATFLILPMLGEKHYSEYPRFRNCFLTNEDEICVYTRVGSLNKKCGYGEEELYLHPNFIREEDDEFDATYGSYYFSIPDKWKDDYEKIKYGNFKDVSDEYKDRVYKLYPALEGSIEEI